MEKRQPPKPGPNPELSVEVRGKSVDNKLFSVTTDALVLGSRSLLLLLTNRVELGSEIFVTILAKSSSGTFRVVWMNTSWPEQFYPYGVEAVKFEGEMWYGYTPAPPVGAWLGCQRCSQIEQTSLPDVDPSFLMKGFLISRFCEKCGITTLWEGEEWPAVERRRAKRPPIRFKIKVTRLVSKFHSSKGTISLEDFGETINVSREGAYFRSKEDYRVGQELMVVFPYVEDQAYIEVPAKVVRVDEVKDSPFRQIAIHLAEKEIS